MSSFQCHKAFTATAPKILKDRTDIDMVDQRHVMAKYHSEQQEENNALLDVSATVPREEHFHHLQMGIAEAYNYQQSFYTDAERRARYQKMVQDVTSAKMNASKTLQHQSPPEGGDRKRSSLMTSVPPPPSVMIYDAEHPKSKKRPSLMQADIDTLMFPEKKGYKFSPHRAKALYLQLNELGIFQPSRFVF